MPKNRTLFLVDYCLTPSVKMENAGILCEGPNVIAIGGATSFSYEEQGLNVIRMKNTYALPGLIDCHIHADMIFNEKDESGGTNMEILCRRLASHGITSFVPALRTAKKEVMISRLSRLSSFIRKDFGGAAPVGIHLDGPFLNAKMLSSHPTEFVSKIDFGYAKELVEAGSGRIKLCTLAPELEGSEKLIEFLLENGIIPSIGHSVADEETTLRAIEAGARRATDLFTTLPQFDFRTSSVTDVLLTDDRVSVEIIPDGSILSSRAIDLVMRVKPARNVIAISDSYTTDPAKSDFLALDSGWRSLKQSSFIQETNAAMCFTSNPANNIGLVSRGELCPGKFADIVFFNTANNAVHSTFVAGRQVYSATETK